MLDERTKKILDPELWKLAEFITRRAFTPPCGKLSPGEQFFDLIEPATSDPDPQFLNRFVVSLAWDLTSREMRSALKKAFWDKTQITARMYEEGWVLRDNSLPKAVSDRLSWYKKAKD